MMIMMTKMTSSIITLAIINVKEGAAIKKNIKNITGNNNNNNSNNKKQATYDHIEKLREREVRWGVPKMVRCDWSENGSVIDTEASDWSIEKSASALQKCMDVLWQPGNAHWLILFIGVRGEENNRQWPDTLTRMSVNRTYPYKSRS